MSRFIGRPVERVEDKRFLTGRGRYTDDLSLPGMLHACIVRSDVAHAQLLSVDVEAARAHPGVVAVFTGRDMAEDGVKGIPTGWAAAENLKEPPHYSLATERVRHVGDGIAVVIAETREAARDAAERVEVDYDILPAVTDARSAVEPGAPRVHTDVERNIAFTWSLGNKEATDAAIEAAHHVTRYELVNQRLVANALEPRSALGEYHAARDEYTLYTTSQNPHLTRLVICLFVLGLPENKVRVVAPDVGGGFGSKIFTYAEEVICLWAARKVGRPVKWTAVRSESFVSDAQGRDHQTVAELALDEDGIMTGFRIQTVANLGAYLSLFAPGCPTWFYGTVLSGCYRIPNIYVHSTGVFTNTVPVDAYRGAGRPEATFLVERIVEMAAHELGMDPAELRRKNFIQPEEFPYETPVALTYDSGDYERALDRALELADYHGWRERQAAGREVGRLIGIGFSSYVEACGIAPSKVAGAIGVRIGLYDAASIRVQPTGSVSVFVGVHSHGQGHETAFAQIVADRLGVPLEQVDIVHGDTDRIPVGMGTYGSRSLTVGGSAVAEAADKIVAKARKIAAHKLEVAERDVVFTDGRFAVKGTDRSLGMADIALTAYVPHDYPEGLEPGLEENAFYDPKNWNYPFGTHICIVEVDADTGVVEILKYVAVDDVGNIINPMIVEGQIHGGVAQGIGQALYEGAVYDDYGQPVTGSLLDYAFPKATQLPMFETDNTVTPCPHNPLGTKGVGEAGTIGSTPAVVNAVVDALSPFGVDDVRMPMTPERVWRALQGRTNGANGAREDVAPAQQQDHADPDD